MLVYVARKINMAFTEGWGLWRNAENIIFTFTLEGILISRRNRTNMKKCNLAMYYRRYLGTRKIQI